MMWYLFKNGQQEGPFDVAQMLDRLESGYLQPSDLIWREGMDQWTPAESVYDLPREAAAARSSDAPPPVEETAPVAEVALEMPPAQPFEATAPIEISTADPVMFVPAAESLPQAVALPEEPAVAPEESAPDAAVFVPSHPDFLPPDETPAGKAVKSAPDEDDAKPKRALPGFLKRRRKEEKDEAGEEEVTLSIPDAQAQAASMDDFLSGGTIVNRPLVVEEAPQEEESESDAEPRAKRFSLPKLKRRAKVAEAPVEEAIIETETAEDAEAPVKKRRFALRRKAKAEPEIATDIAAELPEAAPDMTEALPKEPRTRRLRLTLRKAKKEPAEAPAPLPEPPAPSLAVFPPLQPPKKRGYFARHWRGELSLGKSFWVNGVLPSFFLGAIAAAISFIPDFAEMPQMAGIAMCLLLVLSPLLAVWQLVGLWRAQARKRIWTLLVRAIVIAGVAGMLYQLALRTVPQLQEFGPMAMGADSMGEAAVSVSEDGSTLILNGPMVFGTAERVREQLRKHADAFMLELESPGGRIAEARQLREIVGSRNLMTYTARRCMSACALVFAAGQERLIGPKAEIGFRQYTLPGMNTEDFQQQLRADMPGLVKRGFDAALLEKAASFPPEQAWMPSHEELQKARFITGYAADNF